jgi:ATP-dependent Clp protease adaptor protein ClpS
MNQPHRRQTILPRLADKPGQDENTGVLTQAKPKTKKPPLYKVIMLNDDYTPMEFVVHVLEKYFQIRREAAVEIMMTVHMKGAAVVGVFTYEVAETKVAAVMDDARRNEHPLTCRMEKE